jgi:hypothetical protein
MLDTLRELPGVQEAAAANDLPASRGYLIRGVVAEGRPVEGGEDVNAIVHAITSAYFDTLQIPLERGRAFTASETRNGADVAIVSRSLALSLWGEREPVGRRLRGSGAEDAPWLTVVGVVGDVDIGRDMVSFGEIPSAQLYVPFGRIGAETMSIAIRSDAPPKALATAVREALRDSAPGLPVSEILTMEAALFRVRWVSRFFSRQLVLYAGLATLISAIGLYGLTADAVSRRTRELAVRVAFGADRSSLIRLVVSEALVLGGIGVGLGLGLSLAITRFASAMFAGVGARDPLVFASVAILLLGVTLLASFLPAREASIVDPMTALRTE